MKVTYLKHSGFHVELPSCCLLFDFVEGNLPSCDKPLYVFVSHRHHDHYDERIYQLQAKRYHQCLSSIAGRVLDVAFVVLDPRQEKQYDLGMLYFMEMVKAAYIFPMHMWEKYEIVQQFQQDHPHHKIMAISKPQEEFTI